MLPHLLLAANKHFQPASEGPSDVVQNGDQNGATARGTVTRQGGQPFNLMSTQNTASNDLITFTCQCVRTCGRTADFTFITRNAAAAKAKASKAIRSIYGPALDAWTISVKAAD